MVCDTLDMDFANPIRVRKDIPGSIMMSLFLYGASNMSSVKPRVVLKNIS